MAEGEFVVVDGEVSKIDLVGAPANEEEFLLMKSEDHIPLQEIMEKRNVEPQELAEFVASHVPGASPADMLDAMDELAGEDSEISNVSQRELAALVADSYDVSTGDVLNVLSQIGRTQNEMNSQHLDQKSEKGGSDSMSEQDEPDQSAEKSDQDAQPEREVVEIDGEVMTKAELKKELQERDERLEEIQKELDLREREEYVEKNLSNIQGSIRQKAELVKAIDENLDEENAELLRNILEATDAQVDKSEVFQEFGSSKSDTNGTASASEKVNQRAEELVSDGRFESKAKAKKYVITEESPQMYKEYRKERKTDSRA